MTWTTYDRSSTIVVWDAWSTSTTSTVDVCDSVWSAWGSSTTSTTVTSNQANLVWGHWVTDPMLTTPDPWVQRPPAARRPPPTAEEIARREEQRRLDELERQARIQARQEARLRARKLLEDNLSPRELQELKANKHFFVYAPSGRKYKIEEGSHGNVKLVDPNNDNHLAALCAQPHGVPEGDSMLAQKLMLLCDEDAFLKVANHSILNRQGYRNALPRRLRDKSALGDAIFMGR